ncbi:MAG: NlpC/P60 family protein [Intrasporangium sp.]|uniref:C40 family peptidase n=1 Tax=Intrasporangium sp. TaxID=1925024 RepID=UPI002648B25B|nr:NlpC/P60 family protein [Intrasporangium sp.]MDN5795872.1 NlpC/P60 family protein [Intrasporangium sp.]
MPAPLALAAVAAKRVLWRRVRRVLYVLAPIVGTGILALALLGALSGGSAQQAVPGGRSCPGSQFISAAALPGLTTEQAANARIIVAVGRELEVPAYGWVIAVATAMQESTLRNLPYGDRDRVGLFQQRAAWGTTAERMDPATAARMFYTGGHGGQPGLMQIPGFEHMPLTDAAQAVQRSAFPDAYAKWQPLATQVVGEPSVLSADCYVNAGFTGDGSPGSVAVEAALSQVGVPYSWGGGTMTGPSLGFGSGAGVVGFDCSSLVQYAWHQAGVDLPRVATAQASAMASVPLDPSAWRAGDLVFFHAPGDPPGFYHHVGIYDGAGGLVHAPRTGLTVEVVHDFLTIPFFHDELAYVGRPTAQVASHG